MKKIIAVDFDNTIAITEYPTIIAPIQPIINYIKRSDAILILWTCRHGEPLADAILWCKQQDITFDYINENVPELIEKYGDTRKIYADEYIDDKSINIGQTYSEISNYITDAISRGFDNISCYLNEKLFKIEWSDK